MKVHLIKEKTIRRFAESNSNSKASFNDWLVKCKTADWNTPADIKNTYNTADILGNGGVVFNLGGNKYRMIARYGFGQTEVHLFICWIGTHAAYDKLCATQLQYSINLY